MSEESENAPLSSAAGGKNETAASSSKQRKRRRYTVWDFFGEVCVTLGVLVLLFVFYELYYSDITAGRQQDIVSQQLDQNWDAARANPRSLKTLTPGEGFARLYIPRFGTDYRYSIVEGTDDADLWKGPGHYVNSQMPGEPGNFAVAGHRVGKGAPFNDLDNLEHCDAVIVETYDTWDIYRVLPITGEGGSRAQQASDCFSEEQVPRIVSGDYSSVAGRTITTPDDVATVAPLPGSNDLSVENLEPVLTLTTCHPQFSSSHRMIIHAMLVKTVPKSDDGSVPEELTETYSS